MPSTKGQGAYVQPSPVTDARQPPVQQRKMDEEQAVKPTVRLLVSEVPSLVEWKKFGCLLGLSDRDVEIIRANNANREISDCMMDVYPLD